MSAIDRLTEATTRLRGVTQDVAIDEGLKRDFSPAGIEKLRQAVNACIDEPVFREALVATWQAARDVVSEQEAAATAGRQSMTGETTIVNVVRSFGDQTPIGRMEIRTDALPPTPDYVFSLGYRLEGSNGEHTLLEIALQTDAAYSEYLRASGEPGVVPTHPTCLQRGRCEEAISCRNGMCLLTLSKMRQAGADLEIETSAGIRAPASVEIDREAATKICEHLIRVFGLLSLQPYAGETKPQTKYGVPR